MLTREQHFTRINSYHQSIEYAEFCKTIGTTPPFGCTKSLLSQRWEIDERLFNEFRDILPPLNFRGSSFLMREFIFGQITTKYTREGERYFCQFVDASKEPR